MELYRCVKQDWIMDNFGISSNKIHKVISYDKSKEPDLSQSDVVYEEKDIANAKDPRELLGRSMLINYSMPADKTQSSSMWVGADLKFIEENLECIKDLLRANSYSESVIDDYFQGSNLKPLLKTTIATLSAEKNDDKKQEGLKLLQSKFDMIKKLIQDGDLAPETYGHLLNAVLNLDTQEELESIPKFIDTFPDISVLEEVIQDTYWTPKSLKNFLEIFERQCDKGLLDSKQRINNYQDNKMEVIRQIARRTDFADYASCPFIDELNEKNKEYASKIVVDERIPLKSRLYYEMLSSVGENNQRAELIKEFVDKLLQDKDFDFEKINPKNAKVLRTLENINYDLAKKILTNETSMSYDTERFLRKINESNIKTAEVFIDKVPLNLLVRDYLEGNVDVNEYLTSIEKYKENEQEYHLMLSAYPKVTKDNFSEVKDLIALGEYTVAQLSNIIKYSSQKKDCSAIKEIIDKIPKSANMSNEDLNSLLSVLADRSQEHQKVFFEYLNEDERHLKYLVDTIIPLYNKSFITNCSDESFKLNLFKKIKDSGINLYFGLKGAKYYEDKIPEIEAEYKAGTLTEEEYKEKIEQEKKNISENSNLKLIDFLSKAKLPKDFGYSLKAFNDSDIDFVKYMLKYPNISDSYYQKFLSLLSDKCADSTDETTIAKRTEVFEKIMEFYKTSDDRKIDSLCSDVLSSIDSKNNNLDMYDELLKRKDLDLLLTAGSVFNRNKDIFDGKVLNKMCENKELDNKSLNKLLSVFEYKSWLDMYKKYSKTVENCVISGLSVSDVYVLLNSIYGFSRNGEKIKGLSKDTALPILKKLPELKQKYGFDKLFLDVHNADDKNLRFRDDTGAVYKFSLKTQELTSVMKGDTVENVQTGAQSGSRVNIEINESYEVPVYKQFYVDSKTGEPLIEETLKESKIKGEYNVYTHTPDGKKYLIGLAEYDGNGGRHIEKSFTSLDGTKSNYVFADDKDGNSFLDCKIIDKDGNLLYKTRKSRKVLSENHYQTSNGDKHYDIEIKEDKIVITKLNDKKEKTEDIVEYNIVDFSDEDYKKMHDFNKFTKYVKEKHKQSSFVDKTKQYILQLLAERQNKYAEKSLQNKLEKHYSEHISGVTSQPNVVDRRLIPMLKGLSGDEWFVISKNTKFLIGNLPMQDNAASFLNAILVSEDMEDNLPVFEHELGHQKFHNLDLAYDKKLRSIYEQEKELYTQTFSDVEIDALDYFLANNDEKWRGLNEASAETNLLINGPQAWNVIQDRTVMLQHFFPRTMAYIANKYDNCA